jgi:hypothetical protein
LLLGIKTLSKFYDSINNGFINPIDKKFLELVYPVEIERCAVSLIPPNQSISEYFDNNIIIKEIDGW